jgi:hypothetical protein
MGSCSALKLHCCSKSNQSGEYSRRNSTTAESARGAGAFAMRSSSAKMGACSACL